VSGQIDNRPGGHVFIVPAAVQNLACDAWCISCDMKARPKKERWLPRHIRDRYPEYGWPAPPADWVKKRRSFKITNWPDQAGPRPWLLNVGGMAKTKIDWYMEGVREFFSAADGDIRGAGGKPLFGRAKHLVALPAVGIGRGGLADQAGEAVRELMSVLYDLARRHDLDIALCVPRRSAFAAAQAARSILLKEQKLSSETVWPAALTDELRLKAKELARYASQGKLALLIGAGVSAGAGLPLWGALLDRLAADAGMAEEWQEVKSLNLPLLDQPLLIEKRLTQQRPGKSLGEAVCEVLAPHHHYSLTHALLAGLPVREAVTTNYDQLFEAAWSEGEEGKEAVSKPPVLPYAIGPDLDRWLLKLHGCVSHPQDIVLTRDDYLEYAEQRGALAGVVQTLLITRHLLIVGFSLDDPNFYQIVDAVRRVLRRRERPRSAGQVLGTTLMVEQKRPVQALWKEELDWVSTGQSPMFSPEAARLQEIFLDYVGSRVRDASRLSYMLKSRYANMLTAEEKEVAELLHTLGQKLPPRGTRRAPVWDQIEELLCGLGYRPQGGGKT
jgi:hypothetical protein